MKREFNLMIGLLLVANLSFSQIDLQDGLIAHFPFDGNALDNSGNNNDGQVNGPVVTMDRFGAPNSAYLFDGVDDIIEIPNYSNMSPTKAVSIVAWIKTSSTVGNPTIYDRLETNNGFGLRLNSDGNLRLTINGGTQDAVSSTVISDGQWHHVIGTYDKNIGELKVYVDGIEDGSSAYSSSITYFPEPRNNIGAVSGNVDPAFFDGSIDGLRIYNRALNLCEIQTLAEVQIDLQNGLIAHFPFDGNALDDSGNNNDGQVNGPVLTMDRFGTPNSAYLFDGVDDIIEIPNYSNMSPTEAVSIVAWIKTSSTVGNPTIYDRLETNNGFGLRLNSDGNLRLTINGGTQDAISSTVISDGQWHHVIGTYDKNIGELKVYIDGIEEGSSAYSSSITYFPEPRNNIGAVSGNVDPALFDGSIDGLRIYNRALNLCEIQILCPKDSTHTVSTQDIFNDKTMFTLYPTPANDFLYLKSFNTSNSKELLRIIDMFGNIILQKTIRGGTTSETNIMTLANGTYILQITANGIIESKIFIKI